MGRYKKGPLYSGELVVTRRKRRGTADRRVSPQIKSAAMWDRGPGKVGDNVGERTSRPLYKHACSMPSIVTTVGEFPIRGISRERLHSVCSLQVQSSLATWHTTVISRDEEL